MATDYSVKPNFRARQLGRTLRRLREQLGLTQEEAGKPLRFSKSKLCRVEQRYLPDYHGFRALLDRYGIIVSDWDEYIEMYDRAKRPGWWQAYGLRDRGFVSMEADACMIREFHFCYIPGLLQSEPYMREVFASGRRPLEGEELEIGVTIRLRRQRRLVEEPLLALHAVVDESVLRRPVLSGVARAQQLDRIVELAQLPNVTVQVVPESIGAYPGQKGNVVVVSFPDAQESDIAYVEHMLGPTHVERKEEVAAARLAFEDLADRALDAADSIALIRRLGVGRCLDVHNGLDRRSLVQEQLQR